MSRTTTITLGSVRLNVAVILGQFFVLAMFVCLSAQNALAAITPGTVDQDLNDLDLYNRVIIDEENENWVHPSYYYDHEEMEGHLVLGELYPTGTLSVQDNKEFYFGGHIETDFEGNTETNRDGGALYIFGGTYTLEAVWGTNLSWGSGTLYFQNNSTSLKGGAIYILGSTSPTELTLRGTSSPAYYYYPADANLDPNGGPHLNGNPAVSVIFEGNKATGTGLNSENLGGGAIYNDAAVINIENVRFGALLDAYAYDRELAANTAERSGGAIYNNNGTINFIAENVSLINNQYNTVFNPGGLNATNGDGDSYIDSATGVGFSSIQPTTHTLFNGNTAKEYGGAIYTNGGTISFDSTANMSSPEQNLTVNNNPNNANPRPRWSLGEIETWTTDGAIFHNNTAGFSGGAIYNNRSTLDFTAVTSITNTGGAHTATSAPAALPADARLHYIVNTTANGGVFRWNEANQDGGAFYHNPNNNTLTFSATAGEAFANAEAIAQNPGAGGMGTADATVDLSTSANAGIFEQNQSNRDGGALFNNNGVIEFSANATGARATATANANTAGDNGARWSRAAAQAIATTNANGGAFDHNTAFNGRGGAIYNAKASGTAQGGTLRFSATAVAATANANSTADSNPAATASGSSSEAFSLAIAKAYASGADFVDNYAQEGGAIFSDQGVLEFTATATASLNNTSNITLNMNHSSNVYGRALAESRTLAVARSYGATFTENEAYLGGAIYNKGGSLTFTTDAPVSTSSSGMSNQPIKVEPNNPYTSPALSTIYEDTISQIFVGPTGVAANSEHYGHGIAVADVAAAMFVKNRATIRGDGTAGLGGAIYNEVQKNPDGTPAHNPDGTFRGGSIVFNGVTKFVSNIAETFGAAIYNDENGTLTFNANGSGYTSFTGNGAEWGSSAVDQFNRYGNGGVNLNPAWGNVDVWLISNIWKHSNSDPTTGTAAPYTYNPTDSTNNPANGGWYWNGGAWNAVVGWTGIFADTRLNKPLDASIITRRGGAIFNATGGKIVMGGNGVANPGPYPNRYGYFMKNYARERGGAIFNAEGATLDLTGVDFWSNGSLEDGGALYNDNGDITINGGSYTSNTARRYGGAVFFGTANPLGNPWKKLELDGETYSFLFQNNEARLSGGAIYNTQFSEIGITHVDFIHNMASVSGGALWNAGVGTIDQSLFEENTDTLTSLGVGTGMGGALFNDTTGRLAISNTIFRNNHVNHNGGLGGAIYNNGGVIGTITDRDFDGDGDIDADDRQISSGNQFTSNTAERGGAIYTNGGIVQLVNTDFEENVATLGAAIYSQDAALTLGVTAGATSVFEENHAPNNQYESIYFTGTNTLNVQTAVGGTLEMFDPMHWVNGTVTITKNGDASVLDPETGLPVNDGTGTWNLYGESGGTGNAIFRIDTGTLGLMPSTNYTGDFYDFAHGNQGNLINDDIAAKLELGNGTFDLGNNATLVVNGAVVTNANTHATDASKIGTTGNITMTGMVKFDNITFVDEYRTALNEAVLELGTGTNTVTGNIEVRLVGDVDSDPTDANTAWIDSRYLDQTWNDYFDLSKGNGRLYLFENLSNTSDNHNVKVFINDQEQYFERSTLGTADGYVVDTDGYLKMEEGQLIQELTLNWTGLAKNGTWDQTSKNWFGNNGHFARSFFSGDNVVFDNTVDNYVDESHADPVLHTVDPTQKMISIGNGIQVVEVGGMTVNGTGYTFNIASGQTLRSITHDLNGDGVSTSGSINFGSSTLNLADGTDQLNAAVVRAWTDMSFGIATVNGNVTENGTATVNMGAYSLVTADRDMIAGMNSTLNLNLGDNARFSSGRNMTFATANIILANNTATIVAGGDMTFNGNVTIGSRTQGIQQGTAISANNFAFKGNSNFAFDLTNAAVPGAPMLTLDGNATADATNGVNLNIGGGRIDVDGISAMEQGNVIDLITITGNGTLVSSGDLYINGTLNIPSRGDDTMIGLGLLNNDQTLSLMVVDGQNNVDDYLDWTGRRATPTAGAWNITTANWSGTVSGMHVSTFLPGDRVRFGDIADGYQVVNKHVDVPTGTQIYAMEVTGTGYTFDLSTRGSIIADNNINFGNGGTRIVSGQNSLMTSTNGDIVFGTGTLFDFNLNGAESGETILTLNGHVVTSSPIGSGNINVTQLPDDMVAGNYIVLVDADVLNEGENLGTTASTGTLYINGQEYTVPGRSSESGATMYTLDTAENNTQLVMKWVDAGQNTTQDSPLTWTGTKLSVIGGQQYYMWGEATNNDTYANWQGNVGGVEINTFLDGDHVIFDDTAVNKNVTIAGGGVQVQSMDVRGTGYTFDLLNGGIHSTGNINLSDSTIVVHIVEVPTARDLDTAYTITADDTITLNGTDFTVDASQIDAEVFRQNTDFDVLYAENGIDPGSTWNKDVDVQQGNALYIGEFFVDGQRGYLRLGLYDFTDKFTLQHNTGEAANALNVLRYARWGDTQFGTIMENPYAAIHQLRGTELVADALAAALWSPWEITHRRMRTTRDDTGWNTWGEGYYRTGHTSDDGNALSYDFSRGGTMIGADFGANRYWHIGGTFGYGLPGVENDFGKIEGDDLTLGLYSKINFFDIAAVTSFFGYGYQNYEMTRHDFAGKHQSEFGGDALYASVEFARPMQSQWGLILPLIALDHQTAWTKQFSEGGTWGQTVSGSSMDRTMIRFGVDGKWQSAGSFALMTRLQGGFLLEGDKYAEVVSHFPGSTAAMTLRGVDTGALQVNAGISANGAYRQRYHWFMDLDGYLAGRTYAVQGQVGLSTRW